MNWNQAAPAAIVGAVVATTGIFFVELWLKPAFARKRVASILLVEVRLNVRLLNLAIEHRKGNSELVSESFSVSTRGWDSVAAEIHHLPESTLRPLLLLYNQYREINDLVASHSRKGDFILQIEQGPHVLPLMRELQDSSRLFGESLESCLRQSDRTLVHLQRLVDEGPPDFSQGA